MTDLKIIIPMAGAGRRLEPLTKSRPKALIRLTDRRLLDHVLDSLQPLAASYDLEYLFIIGHLGEQIRAHMAQAHPNKKVTYFVQEQLTGQSSAVYLAREALFGPVLLTYCDTINLVDYSFLPLENADAAASVWEVEDPSRFGVAAVGADGLVTKLIEKPKTREHRAALTGIYYFHEGRDLIRGIQAQMAQGALVNNEYYLADAINLLVQTGLRLRTIPAARWLDAGTPWDFLATNGRILQDHPAGNPVQTSSLLIPPYYIHSSARVEGSKIGPNVSIGKDCILHSAVLRDSIVDDGSSISDAVLDNCLIGRGCIVRGRLKSVILADHEKHDRVSITED